MMWHACCNDCRLQETSIKGTSTQQNTTTSNRKRTRAQHYKHGVHVPALKSDHIGQVKQLLVDAAEQVSQLELPETGISDEALSIFNINRHNKTHKHCMRAAFYKNPDNHNTHIRGGATSYRTVRACAGASDWPDSSLAILRTTSTIRLPTHSPLCKKNMSKRTHETHNTKPTKSEVEMRTNMLGTESWQENKTHNCSH